MKEILMIGVGGAGCSIARKLGKSLAVEVIAISSNEEALNQSEAKRRLLLDCDSPGARSPSGALTEVAIDSVSGQFRRYIEGSRLVILAVGLGGNTGSGAAPLLARIARAEGREIVAIVTLPFAYEDKRRPVADAAVARLQEEGVKLIIHDHSVESRRVNAKNRSLNDYLNSAADSFRNEVAALLQ